ncbi:CsbD family protein [Dongia soli]
MRKISVSFIAAAFAGFVLTQGVALQGAAAQDATSTSHHDLWNKIAGNWTQFKGQVREQWGKLTDDDLMEIQGQRQQLVGKIQARYGISLEKADEQVREWENKVAQ